MHGVLLILHVLLGLALIGVILVQTGKGADIGAAFGGGSSQTVFGGRGPTTFLHRLTTAIAALFMATSLFLTIYAARREPASVIPETPAETAPTQTETAPVETTPTQTETAPAPTEAPKPASEQ